MPWLTPELIQPYHGVTPPVTLFAGCLYGHRRLTPGYLRRAISGLDGPEFRPERRNFIDREVNAASGQTFTIGAALPERM